MRACTGIAMPRGVILFMTKVIATTYNFSVQVPVSLVNFSLRHVWCHDHGRHATCGVAVTVTVLCMVSLGAVIAQHGCHSHGLCAACGVVVMVIAPHVVSRSRSLHHMWFCSRGHCTMCGFMVTVIVLCGCHGCGRHAMCGVMGAVVVLHVVSWWWWLALEGEDGHASIGKGGGESAVTGTTKEEVSRKKKKETIQAGGKPVQGAWRHGGRLWVQRHGEVGA